MKKTIQKSFTALIILMCMIPSVGLLVLGPSKPAANEISPAAPSLLTEEGHLNSSCLRELTDYVAGSFALRRECISAWSWLNERLFHTSVQDQVVLGRNGWLYFSETLNDYQGAGLTDEQLEAASRNLSLIEEYVRLCGADFIFTAAPDKNSLYPENMPSYYISDHANSNAERLEVYLEQNGVSYVNLFDAFEERSDVLYYKTDTHWNAEGAAYACDVLLVSLGRESCFSEGPFLQSGIRKGDLYEMLIPEGRGSETGIAYGGVLNYECEGNPKEGNAIRIKTTGSGTGRLKCWRDSFGIEMYPYLSQSFETAEFSRLSEYDLLDVSENYDTVIIELCERNLAQLLSETAIYPAPERELPSYSESGTVLELNAGDDTAGELKQITAALPDETDCGESIFIVCKDKCYEAAVTFSDGCRGISAYIPKEAEPEGILASVKGEYQMYVCINKN